MQASIKLGGSKGATAGKDVQVLKGESITIGRNESCDVSYPSDSRISARHCKLTLNDDCELWLQVLGSPRPGSVHLAFLSRCCNERA
eukprot:1883022-Prymnesium_polylepis.1